MSRRLVQEGDNDLGLDVGGEGGDKADKLESCGASYKQGDRKRLRDKLCLVPSPASCVL